MPNFNKVILAGNLSKDPECRYTPKGTAVAKISLAINRQWKDESGQQKDEVTFVDVDAFGRQAEVISQYLKKGRPILVEGRLKLEQWDDKQTGQKKSRLGVVLESFQFLDSGGSREGCEPRSKSTVAQQQNNSPAPPEADAPPDDDEAPF